MCTSSNSMSDYFYAFALRMLPSVSSAYSNHQNVSLCTAMSSTYGSANAFIGFTDSFMGFTDSFMGFTTQYAFLQSNDYIRFSDLSQNIFNIGYLNSMVKELV